MKLQNLFLVAAVLTAFSVPALAEPVQQTQNDIAFITGGIGEDDTDTLKANAQNYNFHLLNSDKDGHYMADTEIVIAGKDGQPLVEVASAGPLFYAQLPAGTYMVHATHGAQHQMKNIRITAKQTELHLVWQRIQ